MSNVNVYGLNQLYREPGAKLSKTLGGAEVFQESRVGRTADVEKLYFGLPLDILGPFGLTLVNSEVHYDVAKQAHLRLRWEGLSTQVLPAPLWQVVRTPREEPIDTHKNFVDEIGGTPDDPLHNAQFDEDGNFIGFPATLDDDETPNPMRGVERFLEASMILSVDRLSFFEPDVGKPIPRLDTPRMNGPSRGVRKLPTLATGEKWFKWDLTYVRRGNVFDIHEEWIASGHRGINEILYPESVPA